MKAQQIPDRVRRLVAERSQGLCEICGRRPAQQLHHRRPRKMGGSRRESTNTPANLLAIDALCHADIESSRLHAESFGWLIPDAVADPARMPVLLATAHGELFCLLDHEGGKWVMDLVEPLADALSDCKGEQ